jgi:hypothetical protein
VNSGFASGSCHGEVSVLSQRTNPSVKAQGHR